MRVGRIRFSNMEYKMKKENQDRDSLRIMEALYGPYFSKNKGLIEIRFIEKPSGKCFSNFYHHFSDINDDVLSELRKLNIRHNIYFGVNPRALSKRKKQDDIENVVCLWADLDGKDFQNGKEDAFQSIKEFSPKPNIIVDSGNGYHAYWILKEPIINVDDDMRLLFKQVLSGVIRTLHADSHAINLDRIMRLPGTYNIKKEDPLECKIISLSLEKTYSLDDFNQFKDERYVEPDLDINAMPDFGEQEIIVRTSHPDDAQEDVKKLEIQSKYKKLIITGALKAYHDEYKSRSERDMAIICALISADYNYATIRSTFFNQHLGCSERIIEKGEEKLRWDVLKALELVRLRKPELTREQQKILNIKLSKLYAEQKRIAINKFILQDLISGENPIGLAFREKEKGIFYYFDHKEKWLMDVEGVDFYCFLRDRYDIGKKEKDEILDAIKTEIWNSKNEVEAHRFSYFDETSFTLYLSDHNNGIFKIDGDKIEHVDNGTDGVFFEFNSDFTPLDIDVNNLEGTNYFEKKRITIPKKRMEELLGFKISKWPKNQKKLGFDWNKFKDENSYVRQFLIDRTNFAQGDENSLSIEEQKYLLLVYFYSLFFESIQKEKPIVCFVGRKESGKSFIATSIGKMLFGDNFQSRNTPDDLKDLTTIMGENYYMVFDNLDHYMKHKMIDAICNTATGIEIARRKLYTDHDVVKIRPRIFLAITTREAKFKRDDLVSRLLLFYTRKINRPKSRAYLFKGIKENRNKIMAEVLLNLNSIVKLLKIYQNFVPDCISRIADWEMFGRKVVPGFSWALMFRGIFEKLNTEKDKFGLEDDYLYILLHRLVYLKDKPISDEPAAELYKLLIDEAEDLKMKEFEYAYKGPVSIGKRISHIREELESVFDFKTYVGNKNVRYYTFKPIEIEKETEEEIQENAQLFIRQIIDGEQLFLFSEAEREKFRLARIREIMKELPDKKNQTFLLNNENKNEFQIKLAAMKKKVLEEKALAAFPDREKEFVNNSPDKEESSVSRDVKQDTTDKGNARRNPRKKKEKKAPSSRTTKKKKKTKGVVRSSPKSEKAAG
jgi:hypothetical protein